MTNIGPASGRGMWGGRRRQEPPPRPGDAATADTIEGEATTMDGDRDEPREDERPDPAPSAPAIAEERAQQLVANITTAAQGELRELRDQIDDVIREMGERRVALTDAIRSQAEFAEAAINHKMIIGESIAKLRADFEKSRTPLPPLRKV